MNSPLLETNKEQEVLEYISLQHELGMAIGLDLRLHPMLRQFTKVCIRRLELIGVSYSTLSTQTSEEATKSSQNNLEFYHLLSIPNSINKNAHKRLTDFPGNFFTDQCSCVTEHNLDQDQYTYYFNLSHLGFIALHRGNSPIESNVLELLIPIFQRLSISYQASMEHEQLLQAIEAKEKAEKIITHQLFHDELTGLANRRRLMKCLVEDITLAKENNLLGAILYIDLDRFKSVNDTLGHSVGDQLLKTVAQKLSSIVRERDIVARLSGDEFAVLLTDIRQLHNEAHKNISGIIEKIRDAFSKPIPAGEHILHITPSIGIETYSNKSTNADRILRNADTAMYLAKAKGPNASAFYDKKMSSDLERRLEVEKELQIAVKDLNQFELFYQPQYDSEGKCIGAEALIRWSHPNQSLISPGLFIPVAEETGLMLKLGRWVLIQACLHLRILEETGIPESFSKLSVNVSAVQFNQENFVYDLLSIIRKTAINPKLLTIELTESTLIENVNDTIAKMTELRNNGIDISVDDFGTGYSSLAYLNQYPIATLKIDQVFVKDLHLNSGNRAIVNAMIGLGQSLNLSVIAEGVETEEELACLKDMQCYYYQGYHFCRPYPFESLIELLANAI